MADQRFHSYEEGEEMDRFLDSFKTHVVIPTRNSYTARKMGEGGLW